MSGLEENGLVDDGGKGTRIGQVCINLRRRLSLRWEVGRC